MKKRLSFSVLKILSLLLFVAVFNAIPLAQTGAFFASSLVGGENQISIGDWGRPESEITDILDSSANSVLFSGVSNDPNLEIEYQSSDSGLGVSEVELWYSYDSGSWVYFGSQFSAIGTFSFNCPQGDGLYQFLTVAIDGSGNVEDRDGDDIDDNLDQISLDSAGMMASVFVQLDTQPPTINLSVDQLLADGWIGQNLLVNGGFEFGSVGWQSGGQGNHHLVSQGLDDLDNPILPVEGENMFLLGFEDQSPVVDSSSWLWQTVSLPQASSTTLSFWWRMISLDTVDYDRFNVLLKDESDFLLEKILSVGSGNLVDLSGWTGDSGWRQMTKSLQNYAGRTVKLWFEVNNTHDDSGQSWAYVDAVEVGTVGPRLTQAAELDFEIHDASGSGAPEGDYSINGTPVGSYDGDAFSLEFGDYQLEYLSTDLADNQSNEQSIDLLILPDIVINAFSANPAGDDDDPMPDGEWVELYNNSDHDIDVAGWYLYDADDTHELLISAGNSDNNGDWLDGGETVVPTGSSLRVYRDGDGDFSLNNNGDLIRLYNGSVGSPGVYLVNGLVYQNSVDEDQLWQRSPDGIGSWQLLGTDIDAHVLSRYQEANKIVLSIFNIPGDYGAGDDRLEYEIIYTDGDGIERGIAGTIAPETVAGGKTDREFYLGTCSAGGICLPDGVPSGLVELDLYLGGSLIIDSRAFEI
ncbi:MAG: lamin tail domain-containing protein [Patescibacteria group bacterium]